MWAVKGKMGVSMGFIGFQVVYLMIMSMANYDQEFDFLHMLTRLLSLAQPGRKTRYLSS